MYITQQKAVWSVQQLELCLDASLRIQPPHIRTRYYVQNVVARANERQLYSQAAWMPMSFNFLETKQGKSGTKAKWLPSSETQVLLVGTIFRRESSHRPD